MLMLTVPHSGEVVPPEATWLQGVDPITLLTDVDRFVDELYRPGCEAAQIPMVVMDIHRYVLDLNRLPTDIDSTSVEGASSGSGSSFVSGFHWVQTTRGFLLMAQPISYQLHKYWVDTYYSAFHHRVEAMEAKLMSAHGLPRFHMDVHSMPSVA